MITPTSKVNAKGRIVAQQYIRKTEITSNVVIEVKRVLLSD